MSETHSGRSRTPGRVGVVIPAFREEANIANLIRAIREHQSDAEVVVVDDSPDLLTQRAVEALGLPCVSVIHRPAKDGRGSAVIDGISFLRAKRCDEFVEMDADFSHPPSQIPELLRESRDLDLDLLIASRYLPESEIRDWPLSRRLFSKAANALARRLLGVPLADYTNGFRVYSSRAAETIVRTCGKLGKGFIPLSEILVNLYYRGMTVGETPTVFVNRARGESSLNLGEITNAAVGLGKIYRLKTSLSRRT